MKEKIQRFSIGTASVLIGVFWLQQAGTQTAHAYNIVLVHDETGKNIKKLIM